MDTNDGRREMRRVDWDFVPEAVVVGNGEFPVSALPLRMLDTASFTVCCDGAADRYLASGRVRKPCLSSTLTRLLNWSVSLM